VVESDHTQAACTPQPVCEEANTRFDLAKDPDTGAFTTKVMALCPPCSEGTSQYLEGHQETKCNDATSPTTTATSTPTATAVSTPTVTAVSTPSATAFTTATTTATATVNGEVDEDAATLFELLDTDKDGVVSSLEWVAFSQAEDLKIKDLIGAFGLKTPDELREKDFHVKWRAGSRTDQKYLTNAVMAAVATSTTTTTTQEKEEVLGGLLLPIAIACVAVVLICAILCVACIVRSRSQNVEGSSINFAQPGHQDGRAINNAMYDNANVQQWNNPVAHNPHGYMGAPQEYAGVVDEEYDEVNIAGDNNGYMPQPAFGGEDPDFDC